MTRSRHLLHVPIIGQPTDWECGPASLAAILQYLGKPTSVADVARLAGTQRTGTDHGQLVEAARQTGATVFEASGGGPGAVAAVTALVACGLPVLVGWWSMWSGDADWSAAWSPTERQARDCGHYSVVRGFTPETLLMMDPQTGASDRTIGYCEVADSEWHRVWYDTDGPAYERVAQWFMALNFEGRRFAGQLGTGRDHLPTGAPMSSDGRSDASFARARR